MAIAIFLDIILLLASYSTTTRADGAIYPRSSAHQLCEILQQRFPGYVDFPGSAAYDVDNTYFATTAELHPPCIFTPVTTSDVSSVVSLSVKASVPFAVRSGGHAWIPGWSSSNDGVVINLKNFNSTELINSNKSAKIGSGALWADVYTTLQDQGYTVTGGRADSVGVGGLTMGGGFSFYLYDHGFACDNVEEFEIVLANGTVAIASATRNPDLFRGLKGTGILFGIVTHFTTKTIEVEPLVYGGFIDSSESSFPHLFTSLADYMAADFDPKAHLILAFTKSRDMNITLASNIYFYQDPDINGTPAVFQQLQNVESSEVLLNTIRKDTIANLTVEIGAEGFGTRQKYYPFTMINPPASVLSQLWDIARDEFNDALFSSIPGLFFTLAFIPYPEETVAAGVANGRNMLGLDRQLGLNNTYLNVHYYIQWTNASDDATINKASQAAYDRSIALLKERGLYNPFIYLNYAWRSQDVIGHYGEENVKILRELQKSYDPTLVFERLVKGGFKIPKL